MHQNNLKSKSQIKEENYMRFYCKKYLVFTQTIYILFFYLLGLPLFRPISFVEQGQGQFQLSLLPSFHASFLPCFLPSFPASFLPSFLFFYKCKWQMYVRFDANLWFFLLMPLPGKKVWPASHSLGIVSLAC